jgi:hypothetical protein
MLAKGQLTTTPVTSNSKRNRKRRRKVKDNDGSLRATRLTERKEKIVTASPVRLCLNQQQKEFKEIIAATAEQQE